MAPGISASETAAEKADEALTAVSIRSDEIAGFGAVFLANLAIVQLRVLAVAALASPLLIVWLLW